MTKARKSGRYDRIEDATHPGPALPSVRLKGRIETVVAAVDDPNPVEGDRLKRQRVAVNVARDQLEQAYRGSHGRGISTAAYLAGRAYQATMEAAQIGGGSGSCEPASGAGDHEAMIARAVDRTRQAVDLDWRIRRAMGAWAAMLLRGALVDGHSVREMATRNGRASKDSVALVWQEFREALECLGEHYDGAGWTWD